MPSRQRIFLPRFDPAAEFVVLRSFKINGVLHKPGPAEAPATFDKASVNERRLRQLYEWRRIGLASAPALGRSRLAQLNSAQRGADAALVATYKQRANAEAEARAREEAREKAGQALLEAAQGRIAPAPAADSGVIMEAEATPQAQEPEVAESASEAPEETAYAPEDFLDLDADEPTAAHPAKSRDRGSVRAGRGRKR